MKFNKDWLVAVWLVAVAVAVGCWRVESWPPGLWIDEVENALSGESNWRQMIEQKRLIPFSPEATGHPAMTLIFGGISLGLWGHRAMAVRMPSVIFGAMGMGLFYWLLRRWFERRVAIIGTVMMIFGYWYLSLVRLGFEAGYFWFFEIGCLLIITKKKIDREEVIGLGLMAGLGVYSYLAFRYLIVAVGMGLATALIKQRVKLVKIGELLCWFGIVLGCVVGPIFFYARHYPQEVFFRSENVSIFNKQFDINRPKMIVENAVEAIGMLVWRGDPNWRHNMANTSAIDKITLMLLVGGIVILIKERKYFELALLGVFGAVAAACGILTYEPPYIIQPHSLRMLGMMPVVFVAAAWGLSRLPKRVAYLVGAAAIISNIYLYFGPKDMTKISRAFEVDKNETAKILADKCGQKVAVSNSLISTTHMNFWATGCVYEKFSGQEADFYILNGQEAEGRNYPSMVVIK